MILDQSSIEPARGRTTRPRAGSQELGEGWWTFSPASLLSEVRPWTSRSPDVEKLREMGRKLDREREAAIGFKLGVSEGTSEELQRFEDLARRLVQVPKEEVDKLRKEP